MSARLITRQPKPKRRSMRVNPSSQRTNPMYMSVLEQVRLADLFDSEKTDHVSFCAPTGLVEAAKRESGISSTRELGLLALAMVARPDPVSAFFRRTEGCLGPDHDLEY
nr:hypothetical protein [uncultured Rhodopila sp.]